jgi:hypothetical protein
LSLVAVSFSACANAPSDEGPASSDALQAILTALDKTNDAGSARMAIALTFTSPEQTVHVTGDVEYVLDPTDPTSLRERVLLDIPSLGMMPGGEVEMIVGKGPILYVRAPMLASIVPATTPWIKLDPSALPQSQGALGAATAAVNPAAILAAIKDALTVEEVGADIVDGSAATHYRATVDIVKLLPLLADLSEEQPTASEMQEAKDQLKKLGLEMLPIELWVDEAGFLKQMHVSLDVPTMDLDNPGASFSLTLTLSDFSDDFAIEIPPASQVTDLTELMMGGSPTTLQ